MSIIAAVKAGHSAPPSQKEIATDEKSTRKSYTYSQKWRALKRQNFERPSGVPARTFTSWVGETKHIETQVYHGRGHLRKFRPLTTYETLYRSLYLVYLRQRDLCNGLSIQAARSWCVAEHAGFAKLSVSRQYENLRTFKRHYGLSVRRTTSTAQVVPMDINIRLYSHFSLLKRAWDEQKPLKIIVLDETSMLHYPTLKQTLAPIGEKTIKCSSKNEKLASTALLAAEATLTWTGEAYTIDSVTHHEPWIIFRGGYDGNIHKRMRSEQLSGAATTNGWINTDSFNGWIKYRIKKSSVPTWLIMDVFPAHQEETVLKNLGKKGVTPFFIPAGCTSVAQIHDTHVNAQFKQHMLDQQTRFRRQHPQNTPVSHDDLLAWSKEAIKLVGTQILEQGFAQNLLEPLATITTYMAQKERPAPVEPKDEETRKKERAEARAAKVQAAKDAFDQPLLAPQVWPNERNQRSHAKMSDEQKAMIKAQLNATLAFQKEAEDELAQEYREAREDGTTDAQILMAGEIELLFIEDINEPLIGDAAEEEIVALAIQHEEDRVRECVDVDLLPDSPTDIRDYLKTLEPKVFISRWVLEQVFKHHRIQWVDYDMINLGQKKKPLPKYMRYVHEKVGVILWHNSHFIGCIACKKRKTIFVYDSLLNYHVTDQIQALNATAKYFEDLWSTPMSHQQQLCDIQEQGSNDCGVYTVNNILNGMGVHVSYTRQSIRELITTNHKK